MMVEKTFQETSRQPAIFLYAGQLSIETKNSTIPFIGLSHKRGDASHIHHDIRNLMPLPDNCVDIYQSEDVMEHIEYELLPHIINDIYRVLKPGGLFRFSVPDYRCDVLVNRSVKNTKGEIVFDPGGGGRFENNRVVGGGHLWFPKYETIRNLMECSRFFRKGQVEFLHYYLSPNEPVTKVIDYAKGYIKRTPDHDPRVQDPYRPMSIVVDAYKS